MSSTTLRGCQFYVPWAEWNQQTIDAVPPGTVFVDVSGSPTAYWEALRDIWALGETFAIIEHDVVCHDQVAPQFESCECLWGAFGYSSICHPECQDAWGNMFGCTRFRAELIQACPDVVTSIPPEGRDWHNLCDWVGGWHSGMNAGVGGPPRSQSLRAAGFSQHWHEPPVDHHPWFVSR